MGCIAYGIWGAAVEYSVSDGRQAWFNVLMKSQPCERPRIRVFYFRPHRLVLGR
jgi:hypothetical protein